MRPTWVILGVIVIVGAVAYLKLMDGAKGEADSRDGTTPPQAANADPALYRTTGNAAPAAAALPPEMEAAETRAKELLREVASASESRDRPRYDQAVAKLRGEAWDAPSARKFAVKLGWKTFEDAGRHQGTARMRRLDQARRLLSRGVYLDEGFTASGGATPERTRLIRAIQKANKQVMTYGKRAGAGLEGITRPFTVPPGWVPVWIVSREKLRYGHNALFFWNYDGDLNPAKLRAGDVLLLPEEALSVHVHLDRRLLGLFIGDWFVKEYRVGVGRPDKPTPTGTFSIGPKMENPDWWSPDGHVPPLDPKNELGSAWMPIFSDELPISAGFGIHGTNSPQTVGTRCSNGCVRLLNEQATELFWWVRTGSAGGQATTVVIQ